MINNFNNFNSNGSHNNLNNKYNVNNNWCNTWGVNHKQVNQSNSYSNYSNYYSYYNNYNNYNSYQYPNYYNYISYDYINNDTSDYKDNKVSNINIKKIISTSVLFLIFSIFTINLFTKNSSDITINSSDTTFDLKNNVREISPSLPNETDIENGLLSQNARLINNVENKVNSMLESNIINEKERIEKKKNKVTNTTTTKTQNGIFSTYGGNKTYKLNSSERSLLERLLAAEARGESYKGQLAVASVIANRIESSRFPNTVSGVVYQKGQYSPVSNGQINKIVPNATQKKVISEVFDKGIRNIPKTVVYFCYPEISSSKWMINNKKRYGRIGHHAFYYQ